MATVVGSPSSAVAALMLGAAAIACSDVVADSVVVEMSRGEPQATAGRLQSLCWASASAGGVLSAYFSGSLVGGWVVVDVCVWGGLLSCCVPFVLHPATGVFREWGGGGGERGLKMRSVLTWDLRPPLPRRWRHTAPAPSSG